MEQTSYDQFSYCILIKKENGGSLMAISWFLSKKGPAESQGSSDVNQTRKVRNSTKQFESHIKHKKRQQGIFIPQANPQCTAQLILITSLRSQRRSLNAESLTSLSVD